MSIHHRLAAHLAQCPSLPRPVPPVEDPAYQEWRVAFDKWVHKKAVLEAELALKRCAWKQTAAPLGGLRSTQVKGKRRAA